MIKACLTIGFIFAVLFIHAQSKYLPLESNAGFEAQKLLNTQGFTNHTSIQPYCLSDSLNALQAQQTKAVLDKFFPGKGIGSQNSLNINLFPLLGLNTERHTGAVDTTILALSAGVSADITFKKYFTLYGNYLATKGQVSPFLIQRVDTLNIMPGNGLRYNAHAGKIFYDNLNFGFSFSPNKHFNIHVGKDKNFWGYGYRSLFLSDNASNYPFLKLTVNFWRIKYISLFAQMKDISKAYGDHTKFVNKYGSFHLLSWNITKKINLNVFEAVIWQAKDTLQNRQIDVNYLNPVIFFRPVEYSLGSSDNSILGLGLQYKITNQVNVYGQALLDEFVLDKIKANEGWWANKYGLQIGAKVYDPFKVKGLLIQTEYNAVRPFTYSHGSIVQNYAHFYQPLAHPMGANFRDWVTLLQYRKGVITVSNKTIIGNYGTDTSGKNYGGNLFQSYADRAQEYHNYIGQGLNNNLVYNKTSIEVTLLKQVNLRFEIGYIFRSVKNTVETTKTNFVFVALRTNLYNLYNDF